MTPSGSTPRRGWAPTLVLAALAACAPAAGGDDPFSAPEPDRARAGAESHLVRFEVNCDGCSITWSTNMVTRRAQSDGNWSRTQRVWASAEDPATASLSAVPGQGGGPIRYVRIEVNGKLAAEERDDPGSVERGNRMPTPLSVQTEVPPIGRRAIVAPSQGATPRR